MSLAIGAGVVCAAAAGLERDDDGDARVLGRSEALEQHLMALDRREPMLVHSSSVREKRSAVPVLPAMT